MAITITASPTASKDGQTLRVVAAYNPLFFTFTAGASESNVQVALYETDGTTLIAEYKAVPFNGTTAKIDLAPLISSQFTIGDDSGTTTAAEAEETARAFSFRVAHRVAASPANSYTVEADVWTATRSALQFLDTDAPNMASYIATASGSPLALDSAGLFLTALSKPKLFFYNDNGTNKPWLASYSFYIPDEYDGASLQATGLGGTINFPGTGSTATGRTVYQITAGTSLSLADGTEYTLAINAGADVLYSLTVEAVRACVNPRAIKWRNQLGGWDVWVFEGETPRTDSVETVGAFRQPYTTIGTQKGVRGNVRKVRTPEVTVTADHLTLNEATALLDIADSAEVYIYAGELTDATYTKWLRVECTNSSVQGPDTYRPTHSITFTFAYPERFSVRN